MQELSFSNQTGEIELQIEIRFYLLVMIAGGLDCNLIMTLMATSSILINPFEKKTVYVLGMCTIGVSTKVVLE